MRGHVRCFYIVKVYENLIFEFGFISVFWWFFGFFRPLIGLSRFLQCFIGVSGQKYIKNEFLGKKIKTSIFQSPQWSESKQIKRRII
jgi:hypothetical protein